MTNNSPENYLSKLRCYLAGPDVFKPNAREHGEYLKSYCAKFGFEGLFPFDNDEAASGPLDIFIHNKKLLHDCDVVIANLTPYHGPSADVGTVWEIGYAKGLGKLVVGYTDNYQSLRDRVHNHYGVIDGKTPDGMGFDDFGLIDNLMIIESLYCEKEDRVLLFPTFEIAIEYLR